MSAIAAPRAGLPWTRARATRAWITGFSLLAALRLALLAALPAFAGVTEHELLDEMAWAVVFPALFLGVVMFCERRLLRRPPKGMLAAQLAFFCAGAVLQVISLLSAPRLETIGYLVLSGSTLLLGAWFVGVLLVPEN